MKRNIITLIIFVIGTLIITSCSLKVNKDITKFYPPQFPDSTFKLYYGSNETPNDAEIIGTLSIKDAGATLNCDSATVFDLAKIEAGQSGGNALLITKHTRPSIFGSSCHQISGFILKIPDTIGDRDLFLGVVSSSDTSIVKDTSVNKMVKFELPRYLPRAIFSLDGGYGWRTAKISPDLNYEEREFMEHLMSGFVWDISAAYIFKNGYGIKLTYLQYLTSHSVQAYNEKYQTGTLKETQTISYFGPAFVGIDVLGKDKNWFLSAYAGLGYIMYNDVATFREDKTTMTGSTIGWQFGGSLDYKISPQIGIGLNAEFINGVITSMEVNENGYKYKISTNDINSGEGLGQFRIMAGIRYCIK